MRNLAAVVVFLACLPAGSGWSHTSPSIKLDGQMVQGGLVQGSTAPGTKLTVGGAKVHLGPALGGGGGGMKVRLVLAWYDCWVGLYLDRPGKRLYVLPVPCVGFVVPWGCNSS